MQTKFCPDCEQNLPKSAFTSTRAKRCKNCTTIHKLKQKQEMTQRALERSKLRKNKTKTIIRLSDLKKEVQKRFNRWIRERDKGLPCISCQEREISHAGHYISQGSSGALRYHPDNINGQCIKCNVWDHGNLINYRIHLIEKIGEERVKWLEDHRNDVKQWTREELEELLKKYNG